MDAEIGEVNTDRKVSKYPTSLIIKYFRIKTAPSLFLTTRVAKIKRKAVDAPRLLGRCLLMGV